MTPAEHAITHAMQLVEEMPGDADLTSALWLLGQAKARIAAFAQRQERAAETIPPEPPVPSELADTDPHELAPVSEGASC